MTEYELRSVPHTHTCKGCGAVWPHLNSLCDWGETWFCPDCRIRLQVDEKTLEQ